jgi:hypothetical protein
MMNVLSPGAFNSSAIFRNSASFSHARMTSRARGE